MQHRPTRLGVRAAVSAMLMAAYPAMAQAPAPSWLAADLAANARAEAGASGGRVIVYSSVNEQEALPVWKEFEAASGVAIDYVRASDTALIGRIVLEARSQQKSWDILVTTAVGRLPQDLLVPFEPPLAAVYPADAIGPAKRWYGVYANISVPSYNTKAVKPEDLPKTWAEFVERPQWAGRVAIDVSDGQWLGGMARHYGDAAAVKLVGDIAKALRPSIVDGHLALARQVGLGEYSVALSNYLNLTNNVRMAGGPTEYWVLDPVVVVHGAVGINARAPHPAAALLAANFLLSREGQQKLTHVGRIPVRQDVTPNPPDVFTRLAGHQLVPVAFTPENEKTWQRSFDGIFKGR